MKYNNISCPRCHAHPKETVITEYCRLSKPDLPSAKFKAYCIKPEQMEKYLLSQEKAEQTGYSSDESIEDPCMGCKNLVIVELPGTFVEMKTVFKKNGSFYFEEVHQCHRCGTIFRFNNSSENKVPHKR